MSSFYIQKDIRRVSTYTKIQEKFYTHKNMKRSFYTQKDIRGVSTHRKTYEELLYTDGQHTALLFPIQVAFQPP